MRTGLHPIIPPGLVAAFYKGNRDGFGGVLSRLGRVLDHGPYSHSELILSNGLSVSASMPDGGVRGKQIAYSKCDRWDFLPIPDFGGEIEAGVIDWYAQHIGKPYDILGNVRFVTNFVGHSEGKWFCSESNMAALGFSESWRYGPSGMACVLRDFFKTEFIRG